MLKHTGTPNVRDYYDRKMPTASLRRSTADQYARSITDARRTKYIADARRTKGGRKTHEDADARRTKSRRKTHEAAVVRRTKDGRRRRRKTNERRTQDARKIASDFVRLFLNSTVPANDIVCVLNAPLLTSSSSRKYKLSCSEHQKIF